MVFADPGITADDVAAVVRVLETGWITTGRESDALERELEGYLGCPHVVALSSCTAALEVALASLQLPPGARVGVPTWTFAASALAAVRIGATPVLLDVEPDTLNLSPVALAAALAEGLAALVVVHFAGVPVESGVIDSQKSEWLTCPPRLLRTAARLSAGSSVRRVRISRGAASSRPVPSSAALALSTYAWWCLSW